MITNAGEDAVYKAKIAYASALARIAALRGAAWADAMAALCHRDVDWHGPRPIDAQRGAANVLANVWQPLARALPDIERRDDILIAGIFKDAVWVASTGYYVGCFTLPWLGIAPTGRVVNLHYGEFCRIEDGFVAESYVIFDILDLMRQADIWPLPKSLGVADRIPGPATRDGVSLSLPSPSSAEESNRSLKLVEAMIAGLMRYDGKSFESMQQNLYWQENFMWYGPAGIGTARGQAAYRNDHQGPFLNAFPDRVGGNHKARLGDGAYVASTGWPSIRATHLGGGWLGCPPTGRAITMRVMDFWRRDGELLAENWVFIDILDLFNQMGFDIMARMRASGDLERVPGDPHCASRDIE